MKYAVISRYYTNGKITTTIKEVSDNTKNSFKSLKNYDEYIDVWASMTLAIRWAKNKK
jgi:hypothetical protein